MSTTTALAAIPKVYIDYVTKYALPYALGFIGGNILYTTVGAATTTVPRFFTLGVDDAATVTAGGGIISSGGKLVGQYSVPIGAGVISSWIIRKIIGVVGNAFGTPDTSGLVDSINSLVGVPNDDRHTFAGTAGILVS